MHLCLTDYPGGQLLHAKGRESASAPSALDAAAAAEFAFELDEAAEGA